MTGIYVGTSPIKNIYVGTTPVKEVYVGTTKVRPSGYQYSTTFDNSDGWTLSSKSAISGGQMSISGGRGDSSYRRVSIAGRDIKKVTMEMTCNGSTGGWSGGINLLLLPQHGESLDNEVNKIGIFANYSTASGYDRSGIIFMKTGAYTTDACYPYTTTKYNGQHTWKGIIDVTNQTYTFYVDGTQVATAAISSDRLTALQSATFSYLVVQPDTSGTKTIQDLSVSVEY